MSDDEMSGTRAADAPPPTALGPDSLRALDAYFAAEQSNLESLSRAAEASPDAAAFQIGRAHV